MSKELDLSYVILSDDTTVKDFCCGDKRFDEFITTKEALEHQQDKLGVTYLFYNKEQCVGYVTIAMGDLNKASMAN